MSIKRLQNGSLLWWHVAIILVTAAVLVSVMLGMWNTFATAKPPAAAPAAGAGSGGATQTNEGGQVTVKATWNGTGAGPVFSIVMDTHAVDLDGYDLTQLAVLRVDGRAVTPAGWNAPAGGHHREGTLSFPATTSDGAPLLRPDTRAIELVIRDVAGVPERVFRWAPSS